METTLTPPPISTTLDGIIQIITPSPIVTQQYETYTMTQTSIFIKDPPSTVFRRPTTTPTQLQPVAQQVSDARKLKGGAIGGIVAASIVAALVILSAVIFTWRRLSGRGNTDGADGFGGAKLSGQKRKWGLRNKLHMDDMTVTSGTYDPFSVGATARRQHDSKFGRSGSGSSGGYRGTTTLGGNQRNRGSDPFYPPGTTAASSDGGEKSLNSTTVVTLQPTTPPGGASPPVFYEADGIPIQQPAPYANMNPQDVYVMELASGEPQPLPIQRWHVTNPDLESLSSRAPSRVGYGVPDRTPVHTGTNF